ncbi:MAG: carboxyl transferase [Anaerolineaceae bacterium]|nr:MAG: carboxyl transferase [Anaerolineaceae bacterium]
MRAKTRAGGGVERVARQHAKGKLTARERLALLLDRGTFHELEQFVEHRGDELGVSEEKIPGDGVVTGYGQIDGRTVYVYAQDFTVLGGTLGEMHAAKICRVMDLAVQNGKPVVGLLDSGGARIQEGVRALRGYAEIFKRNVLASGIVPQVSVMLGPCAGGAAYSPALTDIIIMVEKQSFMFLTGPDVIKSVTNEIVDHESLGGAEVHTSVSGTAHLAAASEKDALALARRVLSYLPSSNTGEPPAASASGPDKALEAALNDTVPLDPLEPYSMHAVIEAVADRGAFLELMPSWAKNAVTGLARIGGRSLGVVANEPSVIAGVMDINSADKIARFVRFCDAFRLPIVTFVDSPGFLPGVTQEQGGVIRHGAKVLYAYAEASVPKVSVVTRKAYGGAYIVMSSKYLGSDVNLAWPSAEIAVMGAEGAVNILFRDEIAAAPDPEPVRAKLAADYRRKFSSPYTAAALGTVDDVIEPAETRAKVIAALEALKDKQMPPPPRKHGNMPV